MGEKNKNFEILKDLLIPIDDVVERFTKKHENKSDEEFEKWLNK